MAKNVSRADYCSKFRSDWWLLATGAVLLFFSFGPFINPLTPWGALVFFLRYLRKRSLRRGIGPAFLFFAAGYLVSNYLLLLPLGPLGVVVLLPDLIAFFIPLVVFRARIETLHGIGATLLLPCSYVVVESVGFLLSGSAGTWSYTQFGFYPLMQLAALIGIAGITFLLTWFAAVVEHLWHEGFSLSKNKSVVTCFVAVFSAAMLYGLCRMACADVDGEVPSVKVAMIANDTSYLARFNTLGRDFEAAALNARADQRRMVERTRFAASKGAKFILWQEYGAYVTAADEPGLLDRVGGIARAYQSHIFIGIAGISETSSIPTSNRLIWIGPDGTVLDEHHKYRTVPGVEPPAHRPEITVLDTRYGKAAGVVCADADVPHIVKQTGKAGVALLLVAVQDWESIRWFHHRFLPFRAVENGLSVVKAAGDGISGGFDRLGRPLASRDWFASEDRVLISDIPLVSTATLYPRAGFLFPLLCLLGMIWLIALGWCPDRGRW